MAVAFIIDFPGITSAQYDAVMQELDLQGITPPGAISHVAGPAEGGWRVIDTWESPQHFDTFFQNKLGPALHNAGIHGQPQTTMIDVHNYMVKQ